MVFWRVARKKESSDYDRIKTNKMLEFAYAVPPLECTVCKGISRSRRVLLRPLPEVLRSQKVLQERYPVGMAKFKQLSKDVAQAWLGEYGERLVIKPGLRIQPAYLDIPSRPEADFLWCSLDVMVVSDWVKQVFDRVCPKDAALVKVVLRKVGDRSAKAKPVIPSTGEPEDQLDEVKQVRSKQGIGPYYQVIPLKESKPVPHKKLVMACKVCKRMEFEGGRGCGTSMTEEMWDGRSHIFYRGARMM